MSLDFSKFSKAASGSMTTTKAALQFYLPSGTVKVSNDGAQSKAGAAALPDNAAKALGGAKEALTETKEQLEKVREKAKEAVNQVDALAGAEQAAEDQKQKDMSKFFTVTFQFNPATLHISACAEEVKVIVCYGSKAGDGEGSDQEKAGPELGDGNVTVSFKVVFDAVDNAQVFLADMLNLGPTNLGKTAVSMKKSAFNTVRPVAEGFLATVRDNSKRRVIFQWGELQYGGYLKQAECCYTMFDLMGEPVRAEINMTLVCGDHDDYKDSLAWRSRYKEFMKNRDFAFSLSNTKLKAALHAVVAKAEKACILFHKEAAASDPDKGAATINTGALKQLTNMSAKISDTANGVPGKEKDPANLGGIVGNAEFVPIKVHYNPASITICSQESEVVKNETAADETEFHTLFQGNETVMSMVLLFDETDNANAFMLESGIGSPTGLVRAGINMKSKMDGRNRSVAPISELFVAAMASAYSRTVCFVWNKMAFWGVLSEVEVEYTMFHNSGSPIRSNVTVKIRQSGEPDINDSYEETWKRAYENLHKESQKLVSDQRLTSSSGNFIVSNLFRM